MVGIRCTKRHTEHQPTDVDFQCPHCGASLGIFYIEFTEDELSGVVCDQLHEDDMLYCDNCRFSCTGLQYSALHLIENEVI